MMVHNCDMCGEEARHGLCDTCAQDGEYELLGLRAERDRLREVVEMVEWVAWSHDYFCPWCSGIKDGLGHAPDCIREKVLNNG